MIERIKSMRKELREMIESEIVCKEIKPALSDAVSALMRVEFVGFCLIDDGKELEHE